MIWEKGKYKEKLEVDNLVYICIGVTVTLGGIHEAAEASRQAVWRTAMELDMTWCFSC